MAEKTMPCLIILSAVVSGEKTTSLCERLKASRTTRHIPILIIAGKSDDSNIIDYYSHHADQYLMKPISGKELIGQVRALIDDSGR